MHRCVHQSHTLIANYIINVLLNNKQRVPSHCHSCEHTTSNNKRNNIDERELTYSCE